MGNEKRLLPADFCSRLDGNWLHDLCKPSLIKTNQFR